MHIGYTFLLQTSECIIIVIMQPIEPHTVSFHYLYNAVNNVLGHKKIIYLIKLTNKNAETIIWNDRITGKHYVAQIHF